MNNSRNIPEDPLAFIQDRVRRGQIFWTYHVNMRLRGRHIARQAVVGTVEGYEMVECYPEDKYLRSYLVLAKHRDNAFHILFAIDMEGDNVRVVTAYRPDPEEWNTDLRTRRAKL